MALTVRLQAVAESKLREAERRGLIGGWSYSGTKFRTYTIRPLHGGVIRCSTLTSIESNLDLLAEKAKAVR